MGAPAKWTLEEGVMTVNTKVGDIQTLLKFGDCQLHLEFKIPANAKNSDNPNNAGNSGVFMQERYEVQIFDSFQNSTPVLLDALAIGITCLYILPVCPLA